jgi:hypothetical protein
MPLLSRLSFIQLVKEVTQGTAASSSASSVYPLYIPVQDAQGEELPHYITDDSLVNNASLVRGVFQGERDSTFTYNGFLYPEAIGAHLNAAGFFDVYGSGSSHTFKASSSWAQPPSYTIGDYDVVAFRQWAGQVLDQYDITIDAKGGIKHTAKWLGWTSASTSAPAASWPTNNPFLGWQVAVTVGGVATARIVSAGITIKRNTEVIHTLNNTQNPANVFAGPIEVNYKLQATVDNYTEWNQLINNTQPGIKFTASSNQGAGSTFTASSNTAAWTKATISRKGKYLILDAELTAIANATDVGPAQFSLTNIGTSAY